MLKFISINENGNDESSLRGLYKKSFPLAERMPYFILKSKSKQQNADFFKIYDGNELIGLWYGVTCKDIVFIFYLAINENCRGKGYGSRVLQLIKEKYSECRIVLNIEELDENSPNYEQRLKRKAFYSKNGFFLLDYKIKEGSVIYNNLCYSESGKAVTQQEYYELIKSYLGRGLYCIYKFISR